MFNEGPKTYIGLSGNSDLLGKIENAHPECKSLVFITIAARTIGSKVIVRFYYDDAMCGNSTCSTKILGIGS